MLTRRFELSRFVRAISLLAALWLIAGPGVLVNHLDAHDLPEECFICDAALADSAKALSAPDAANLIDIPIEHVASRPPDAPPATPLRSCTPTRGPPTYTSII